MPAEVEPKVGRKRVVDQDDVNGDEKELIDEDVDLDLQEEDESDESSVYSDLEDEDDDEDEDDEDEDGDDEEDDEEDDSEEDVGDDDGDSEEENEDGDSEVLKKVEKVKNSLKMSDETTNKKNDIEIKEQSASKSDLTEIKDEASTSKESVAPVDEYAYDSSDEEDIRNTIGNIPVNWYDDYDHVGYDLDGKAIRKPKRGDELDAFLRSMEDGDHGRTVLDPMTGQDVVLSSSTVDSLRRVRSGKVPVSDYNLYEDHVPWFSSDVMETPLRDLSEPKRSFLPSLDERRKVGRMVHAIKMGWMKTRAEREKERLEQPDKRFYMLWKTDDQVEDESLRRIPDLIPAPKMRLPDHAESYNPPAEYLFTDKELEQWEKQAEEPHKRKLPFVPKKFDALRKVPAYRNFVLERFERCLDLYLAPRARKMRLTIQPEDLLPKLPQPKDLQPFPTGVAITFKGHRNMIRTMDLEPSGQFLVSGSDDKTVRIWEANSGYCMKTLQFDDVVKCVAWCPNKALALVAVAVGNCVYLVNAGVGDKVVVQQTQTLLKDPPEAFLSDYTPPERVKTAITWSLPDPKSSSYPSNETLVQLKFFQPVKQVHWHGKGDYFVTVCPEGQNRSVLIHQLSKWRTQIPFSKAKGLVQSALFHPTRPFLFVATQRHVRVYHLSKQELSKKLQTGAKWISSISIHPKGDNLLVSTYDKKVQWFDLDLSTMPYQVLRYHATGVRKVTFHRRYPLFASCADDCSIIVSHGMVYNDLLQNPLIVPVKHLRGHSKYDDLGIMTLLWHHTQPWLYSAGADGYIKLWT